LGLVVQHTADRADVVDQGAIAHQASASVLLADQGI
jgi:hypothetical protein